MSQQTINVGTTANDGTGDALRNAFIKANDNFTELYTDRISGSGTDNYVPRFNGTNALENSIIFDNGTNVGIGTEFPANPLQVNGAIVSKGGGIGDFDGTIGLGSTGTSLNGNAVLGEMYFKTGGSEKMRIDISGNVGIGTSSPASLLHLVPLSDDNALRIGRNHGYVSFYNSAGTTRSGYIQFNSDSASRINVEIAQPLSFYTSASERMRIASNGWVGIGTSSPAGKLSIVDGYYNTFFSDTSSQYGSGLILSGDAGGGQQRSWKTFAKNGNGAVALTFEVSTNGTSLGSSPTGLTYSEKMRITSAGNVGIGTTSPTAKLQVVGLPSYADNTTALAGGLTAGAFYHTAGVLKVVI